jgi:ketosteroid isomerase-like protein
MSQENVEIVRAAFDAWNRGDHDTLLGPWGEEAEFHPLRAQLEGRAYHGRDGLRRFIVELAEDWEEVRFEVDEVREAGGQLVGFGRFRARGKRAASSSTFRLAWSASCRTRRVVYSRFFSDPADALEAAGLRVGRRRLGTSPAPRFLEPAPLTVPLTGAG